MNVSELYDLTFWIKDEIEQTQIPQKYQALQKILQQNVQPNQQKQPFESQKNDLIETIRNVPLRQLTKEQVAFLHALGIAEAIGEEGVDTIEDILYRNVIDIATAAQKIQEIHQRLVQGIQKSHQIETGLDGCVSHEEYEIENEVLMRVSFTGQTELSNVTEFKKWGNIWFEIGRGLAIVHNATPEDVKIIGATSGSIIIELVTLPTIAATAATVIYSALKLAEKILEIKKKAEEIKNLQLQNKKLAIDLEKEAEKEKKAGIEKISGVISGELNLDNENEGDKVNALEKAIKRLVNFIDYGGEVDFVLPESENGNEDEGDVSTSEYKKLKNSIQEIRLLENKLRLLEAGLTINEDE